MSRPGPLVSVKLPVIFSWVVAIGAILSATLVWYAGCLQGPGITHDSVYYLYAGHSFYEKQQLQYPSGQPFIGWPPLYPLLISGLNILSIHTPQVVFYFQLLVIACTVFLTGKLVVWLIREPVLTFISFTAIVFATPLVLVNYFIWSESLFIGLLVLYARLLYAYSINPRKAFWWGIVAVGSLLTLQRYAGVFFIPVATVVLWQYSSYQSTLQRVRGTILLSALSVLPLTCWWLRNYRLKGQVIGQYGFFEKSWFQHLRETNDVLTAWFLPDEIPLFIRLVLICGLLLLIAYFYFSRLKLAKHQQETNRKRLMWILAYLVLTYLFFFLLSDIAPFAEERFLAPVYIPMMLLAFFCLETATIHWKPSMRKGLYVLCFVWVLYPIARSLKNVQFWHNQPSHLYIDEPLRTEFEQLTKPAVP